MAGNTSKKISAASARAHTRKSKQTAKNPFRLCSKMIVQITIGVVIGFVGYAYLVIRPPAPNTCGSPGGPLVTSPRVKLSDGRHLAYKEKGVAKEEAKHKIIVCHGLGDSKDFNLPVSEFQHRELIDSSFDMISMENCPTVELSLEMTVFGLYMKGRWNLRAAWELIKELRVYILSFDRAGYGESDPHPRRTVKSEAFDIQELADKLQIGPKFYMIGISRGACPVYSCLKYLPHRVSGAALVVPFVNYWWNCFPPQLSKRALGTWLVQDQRTFQIAHYAPWMFNWWMTQKWFPSFSVLEGKLDAFSRSDLEILKQSSGTPKEGEEKILQQGVHECLHRDLIVGFGKWEFEPTDIDNPFPNNEGSVHIWQGYEDKFIPYELNRYLSQQLPWIQYHEVPDAGHLLIYNATLCEAIFKALLSS